MLSLTIIILLHYLWNFLKDNYSTKKTRDLVSSQTHKYKTIIDELLENKSHNKQTLTEEELQILHNDLTLFMNNYMK